MRILCCLNFYLPYRSGLTLHVQRIAEALTAQGHQVTVLSTQFSNSLPREEMLNGVRVMRLQPMKHISRGHLVPGFPWAAYRLLRENDVVQLNSPMFELPLVARLARWLGKGIVITHHGDLHLPGGILNRIIESGMLRFFHSAASRAHHIIVYSDDYAEHSRYVLPHRPKTTALYPPCLVPEPRPEGRAEIRGALGVDSSVPVIGYAGRFVEEKRPDILLRAIPYMNRLLPHFKVAFAGQYIMPYEKFYERCRPLIQRHQARVHFMGLFDHDQQMSDFYSACDVLVLPSYTECFGLVQVEAMLCGTPVVATDIPGAREPVRMTGMGEIVPPRDPLAVAKAVASVISEPKKYCRSREEVEAVFNMEETVNGYGQILANASDGRSWDGSD